jgi:hypothetical protein
VGGVFALADSCNGDRETIADTFRELTRISVETPGLFVCFRYDVIS